jgi:hypothetical protein
MIFIRCLADRFGLGVELGEDGSTHVSLSPPSSDGDISDRVPNVIQVLDDGSVVPVDYELRNEGDTTAENAMPICS